VGHIEAKQALSVDSPRSLPLVELANPKGVGHEVLYALASMPHCPASRRGTQNQSWRAMRSPRHFVSCIQSLVRFYWPKGALLMQQSGVLGCDCAAARWAENGLVTHYRRSDSCLFYWLPLLQFAFRIEYRSVSHKYTSLFQK
jgi:hypothetical protein